MRVVLKSLRMVNFRRFLDKTIEFGPGFNLIVGPNESGKTSIHQAIILALYGLERSRETLSRERAQSWLNDAECLLELSLEVNGVEYRIARSISSGGVRLEKRDAQSGEFSVEADNASGVSGWVAEHIGVRDVQLFNRSVSICQADLKKVSEWKSREHVLEEILYGDGQVTPEAALSCLRDFEATIEKQRGGNRTGKLPEAEEELKEVESELADAKRRAAHLESVREEIVKLETDLPELEKRVGELERFLKRARERAALLKHIQEVEKRLRELEEAHRRVQAAAVTIEKCRQELAQLGPAGRLDASAAETLLKQVTDLEKRRGEVSDKLKIVKEKVARVGETLREAAPRAERLKALRAEVQSYGALAEADLEQVRSQLEEARHRPEIIASRVAQIQERLEQMSAALAEAQSALNERPELGDPEALQAEWLRKETLLEEKSRALSGAQEDFRRARRDQPGGKFRLIAAVISMFIIAASAILGSTVHVGWSALAVLGVAVFFIGLYGHSHARVMWRRNVDAAERRYEQLKSEKAAVERERFEILAQLGTTAEELPGLLKQFRERLGTVRQLHRDIEALEREHDDLLAQGKRQDVGFSAIVEQWGYTSAQELSEALDHLEEARRQVENTKRELRAALRAEESCDPLVRIEELQMELDRLQAEEEACEREQGTLEAQWKGLLEKVGVRALEEAHARLQEVRQVQEEMSRAQNALENALVGRPSLEALDEEVKGLRIAHSADRERLRAEFEGFEPNAMQISQYESEREQLAVRLNEGKSHLERLRGQLQAMESTEGASIADLIGRKEHLESEIERYRETLEAVRKAEEIVEGMMAQPPGTSSLQAAASGHFRSVTEERYREIRIEAALKDIVVVENDSGREVKYGGLSQGALDQMYFALRLALADLLSRGHRLPLLMDDPFVNFDADRLRNALEILARLVRGGQQVVYFTVHDTLARCLDERQAGGLHVQKTQLD